MLCGCIAADDRYLSREDTTFVELVKEDLDLFQAEKKSTNRILLFPPVNSYQRLLIHKTVEEYEDLGSFSVGEGDSRQTVVCFNSKIKGGTTGAMSGHRPPTMRGRGRAKYRDQNSPSPTPGYHHIKEQADGRESPDSLSSHRCDQPHGAKEQFTPSEKLQSDAAIKQSHTTTSTQDSERESVSQVRPRKAERSKNRRPDVQVYVPRSRRLQVQPEQTTGNTGSSPNRSLASAQSKTQQKVKPERGIYIPKPMQHAQKMDQQPLDHHTSISSPQTTHRVEYSNDCVNKHEALHTTSSESAAPSEAVMEGYGNKKLKVHDRRKHSDMELEDQVESRLSSQNSEGNESELTIGVEQAASDVIDSISDMQDKSCNDTTSTSHANTDSDVVNQVILGNCYTEKGSDRCSSQEGKGLIIGPEKCSYTCDKPLAKDSSEDDSGERKDCNIRTMTDECETEVMKDSLAALPVDIKEHLDIKVEGNDTCNENLSNYSCSESKMEIVEETKSDSFANVTDISSEQDSETAIDGKYSAIETDSAIPTIENKASDICDRSQDDCYSGSEKSPSSASDLNTTGNKRISYTDNHDDQLGMDFQEESQSLEYSETAVKKSDEYSNTAASSEPTISSVNQTATSSEPTISSVNQTATSSEPTISSVNQTATCSETTVSSVNQTATSSEPTISSVNQTATSSEPTISSVNQTATCSETTVSSVNQTATSSEPTVSSVNQTATNSESTVSSVNQTATSSEPTVSAVNQTATITETTVSTGDQTATSSEPIVSSVNKTATSSETTVFSVDKTVSEDNSGHQSQPEEPDEDSWDAMFNDDGDCLDPSAMEELTRTVGKVEIQKSKKINYLDYQPKDKGNFDFSQYAHIIEIYDFPKEFVTRDLITAFQSFMSRGFDLKWVDDTHALGIFSSNVAAQDALDLHHPLVKVCPLSQASKQSRDKARRCTEFLQPYKPRPETSAMAARRLVAGALGLTNNVSREKRERERQQLKEAKEKRRKDRKNREDIWEYGKCAMDEET